jgi:hypothetical protein
VTASFRSSTSAAGDGASLQVARPSGVIAGDQMWAIHIVFNSSLAALTAPSGWAPASSRDGETLTVRVWRKTATNAEPGAYSFGQDNHGTIHLLALKDASSTANIVIAESFGTSTTTPPVTPADSAAVEIRVAAVYTYPTVITSWAVPSGYSSRGQTQSQDLLASAAVSRQTNSSSSSGAQTFSASPAGIREGVGVSISVGSGSTIPDVDPPPPFTPGVGDALYRYKFHRLRDGQYLGDLELVNVSFDKRILQPGTFSATIAIPDRDVGALVKHIIPEDETVLDRGPGVITCQVLRGGEYWGEYWITGATPARSGKGTPTIALRGSTLDAYFLQVELQETLPTFTAYDQIDIARELLNHMQSQPYANLGLVLQGGVSGVERDRTYNADEATYGQRLTELAQVDGGFEWMINILSGPAGLERHWVWGMPLGVQNPAPHVFSDDPGGGIISGWSEQIDALRGATRWRARGDRISTDASTSSTPLISAAAEATAHLAAGWPRLDRTINYSSVTEMATLQDYAAYWAATAPGALRVDSVTLTLGAEPSFDMNSLGDTARIHLDNEWHTPHWRTRRIIGIGITPTSRADGKETAQLILEGQEVSP